MTVTDILNNISTAKIRLKEIHTAIHDEVNNDATLADLDSASKTSEFSLWESVVAVITYIVSALFDERKAEVQEIVDENVSANAQWLNKKILDFQYGSSLEFDEDGKPHYAVIDDGLRIVKYIAIIEENGFYTAKVAKDNAGDPIALTVDELNALNSYLNALVLGNNGFASSKNADLAQVHYTIYYKAIRGEATVRVEVEAAIKDYLASLDFAGNMYLSKLEDAIQSISDVKDFERDQVLVKNDAEAEFHEVTRVYNPDSGYIQIDPLKGLANTLTFIPA
jgi:hypothetical protein